MPGSSVAEVKVASGPGSGEFGGSIRGQGQRLPGDEGQDPWPGFKLSQ